MNWADAIWLLAVLIGVIGGWRAGLLSELLRLISWALIAWAITQLAPSLHPALLIGLTIGLLVGAWVLRSLACKITGPPGIPSRVTGLVLGLARMLALMIFVTLGVARMHSPFWRELACDESQCGAIVMHLFHHAPATNQIQRTI